MRRGKEDERMKGNLSKRLSRRPFTSNWTILVVQFGRCWAASAAAAAVIRFRRNHWPCSKWENGTGSTFSCTSLSESKREREELALFI